MRLTVCAFLFSYADPNLSKVLNMDYWELNIFYIFYEHLYFAD